MYTTLPRADVNDRQLKPGGPLPKIIDHRMQPTGSRWINRHRKEQLPYDTLRKHRDVLLEEEIKYKKQIRELEKEREDLVVTYESTYQENQKLKSIVEYGPDAAKLKQLSKDKKEQKGIIEQLEDENKALQTRMKELERLGDPLKNNLMNKKWHETLDKVRKMRAEEDAIPTQGPFVGSKLFKKKRIAIDDTGVEDIDAYDLQLDTIEKESEKLSNKIKQLKREKEQIDYTLMMGKGAVTRNAVVANAIGEKLNRDLNKYAIRLEKLKLKHKRAKEYIDVIENPSIPVRHTSERSNAQEQVLQNEDNPKYKTKLTYKANKIKRNQHSPGSSSTENKAVVRLNGNELMGISNFSPSSMSPRIPFTKARKRIKNNHINSKEVAWTSKNFERPNTYTELHQNARLYSAEKLDRNSDNGHNLSDSFQEDRRIKQERNRRFLHSQGNPSTPRNSRNTDLKRNSLDSKLDKSNNSGREYDSRFESTTKTKEGNITTNNRASLKSAKTNKTFTVSNSQRNTQHRTLGNKPHDDISNDLKKQSIDSNLHIPFKQAYNEKRPPVSPENIKFNNKGRNVGGNEAWQIMGNTGIRREPFSRYLR